MKSFPIFLRLEGERVVVVGGGEAAAQKARLLARTEAEIVLMAPRLEPELAQLVLRGRARHLPEVLAPAALAGARLVLVATGCAGADGAVQAVAKAQGALVNVVDRPALCDATFPALVDRDPLVVAIGTEGASPVLARWVKTRIEAMLEPNLGGFAAMAGRLRERVARQVAPERRRAFWEWAVEVPRRLYTTGEGRRAEAALDAALAAGGAPAGAAARVSVIEPGSGPADLLTLRAVQRLQSADLILLAGPAEAILELARRDAERQDLGPRAEPAALAAAAAAAAAGGQAAVVLTSAPGPVARRLSALGVSVEIVPAAEAARPDDTRASA